MEDLSFLAEPSQDLCLGTRERDVFLDSLFLDGGSWLSTALSRQPGRWWHSLAGVGGGGGKGDEKSLVCLPHPDSIPTSQIFPVSSQLFSNNQSQSVVLLRFLDQGICRLSCLPLGFWTGAL